MQFNAGGEPLPQPLSPQQAAVPLSQWQARLNELCQQLTPLLTDDVLPLLDDASDNSWLNGNKFRAASWPSERQCWQNLLLEPGAINSQDADFIKLVQKYSAANLASAQKKGQPLLSHAVFDHFEVIAE